MKIEIHDGEFWYGGSVTWGTRMPIGQETEGDYPLSPNVTPNQSMPLLLSSQGRCLWLKDAAGFALENGIIRCDKGTLWETKEGTLRSAYLSAMQRYFTFTGAMPAEDLFIAPIFNTWIELTFHQNQEDILRYAKAILANGYQPGVLMIDDGWSESYGDWRFHTGRFSDPGAMLRELHDMGFSVMLWVCPYITADTEVYRLSRDRGLLLVDDQGDPFILEWWNGRSAGLDLSNLEACSWLRKQLNELLEQGVDGFKFDGGDARYYEGCRSGSDAGSNELSRLWNCFGEGFSFNEYRAAWLAGGRPLLQRLCDKEHSWGTLGIAALLPDTLAQGITGHPFCCADMVGGGEYMNFQKNSKSLDREMFLRHGAISCLLPAIQFSAAPWRILTEKQNEVIHTQLRLRKQYGLELWAALRTAARTGEPVVRYMEYEFPHQGMEKIKDQFMLGSELLVAPVIERGKTGRIVFVPKGTWLLGGEKINSSGEEMFFQSPDSLVAVLRRQKT